MKHTISLARDLPLRFTRLRATGRCRFQTLEAAVQTACPGTYGHRVIAVTPRVIQAAGTAPVRGLLSNTGISQIGGPEGTMEPSVRPTDALPISELDLGTTDREIYGEAPIRAKVTATLPRPLTVPVSMPNGIAFSNRPPITDPWSTAPPSPLNVLGGIPADQTISVTIDHIDNVGDVLLGID